VASQNMLLVDRWVETEAECGVPGHLARSIAPPTDKTGLSVSAQDCAAAVGARLETLGWRPVDSHRCCQEFSVLSAIAQLLGRLDRSQSSVTLLNLE
jgi:hypothetical protein